MTEESDNLHRLLRLKSYEHPQDMDAFAADLISKLHVRQREDYLKQTPMSVLWESLTGWYDSLSKPKLALATATAVALLAFVGSWALGPTTSERQTFAKGEIQKTNPQNDNLLVKGSGLSLPSQLLGNHFDTGAGHMQEPIQADPKRKPSNKPFVVSPNIEGSPGAPVAPDAPGVDFKFEPEPVQPKPVP